MAKQAAVETRRIVSSSVPPEVAKRLEQLAQAGYRSLSGEIRIALDEHLRREQLRAQTADARARFTPIVVDNPKEHT